MAKRKQILPPPLPVKQPGVKLPLDYPAIPDSWMPDDDYSSHRPMLYRAIMNTAHTAFVEFGTGRGSTPWLKGLYASQFPNKDFISYENDYQWYQLMQDHGYYKPLEWMESVVCENHSIFYTDNLLMRNTWKGSIVFIDCAPAELRNKLIIKHSSTAKLIIVHDTEPGAEYVYGMSSILNSFNYRCDLIVEGNPQTTIVSNLYEFNNWKTIVNDQIQFI